MAPSSEPSNKLVSLGKSTPITALAFLAPALLLAGSSSDLLLIALDACGEGADTTKREWRVLERERVHRIVVQPATRGTESWRVLVLGGKEAALVELARGASGRGDGETRLATAELTILHRFALADWIHDGAFLSDDRALFITAHNSLVTYTLTTSSTAPILSSVLDSPLRPLLWCATFSKQDYEDVGEVVLAGGSMLGDILLWRLAPDPSVAPEPTKLLGHNGGVFNLAFSPSGQQLASVSDDRAVFIWNLEDGSCRKMWGHEGRIWRVSWINEVQVVSVAEDMKTIVWSVPELDDSEDEHTILQTFTHGHDGRSMWSVSSCLTEDSGSIVVTGGADGGIRSWIVPPDGASAVASEDLHLGNIGGIKAFSVFPLPNGTQRVIFILTDGSILLSLLGHAAPPTPLRTLHLSSAVYCSPIIISTHNAAWIFSSRGTVARIDLRRGVVSEQQTGICAASVKLDGDKLLVYDRREKRIVVLEAGDSDVLSPDVVYSSIALNDSILTACRLSSDRLSLFYGTEVGELVVVALSSRTVLATSILHKGPISDIRVGDNRDGRMELETVGRGGFRATHLLERENGDWSLVTVDRARITRGRLEQIMEGAPGSARTYLAFVDTRALVLNAQGDELLSFLSPGTRLTRQLVHDALGGVHYFRLLGEKIHRQSTIPSTLHAPPPVVLLAFHGREIRCVKFRKISLGHDKQVTLLATGAENASFRISQLNPSSEPITLFSDPTLEGALKSVAWSESANGLFVFASGARETIRAWQVTPTVSTSRLPPELARSSPSRKGEEREVEPQIALQVLSAGNSVPVTEGGEIRLMDMAVEVVDAVRGLHLVVAGCSDGVLRSWLYDDSERSFAFLASKAEHDKCILTVRLLRVETIAALRYCVLTGASDGLVAVWDLAALVHSALTAVCESKISETLPLHLDPPIITFTTHQSGVNGLAACYNQESNTLAIATAGDDNAVAVHQFSTSFANAKLVLSSRVSPRSLFSAHSSTVQGLAFLTPTLLASSSVDQRLNLYSLGDNKLTLIDSVLTSVADCSAMDVAREEQSGGWRIAVVGIGLEVFTTAIAD